MFGKPGKKLLTLKQRFNLRRALNIAIFWTAVDFLMSIVTYINGNDSVRIINLVPRLILVFIMSLIMAYLYVRTFKEIFPNSSRWLNFLAKSLVILSVALLMNFSVNFIEIVFFNHRAPGEALSTYFQKTFNLKYLVGRTLYWMVIFVVTELYLEINDKYAPGVYLDILSGKYKNPKDETRIIVFLDLKDSTPIAEKLGHAQNFLFIRLFIQHVAEAVIVNDGIIYQYVGDEVVVSWPYTPKNIKKAMGTVLTARRNIQKKSEVYRRQFGIVPEFRVGMHIGDVTIGEIGVMKKDLAMSGDTMNTTARIRSACNELNQKFIVSKAFIEKSGLKDWQTESLGPMDLKGKTESVELFALRF